MSIYFDHFQNMFWKWSQLTPICDQNILDSDVSLKGVVLNSFDGDSLLLHLIQMSAWQADSSRIKQNQRWKERWQSCQGSIVTSSMYKVLSPSLSYVMTLEGLLFVWNCLHVKMMSQPSSPKSIYTVAHNFKGLSILTG
jgi:hypothetical protein